MIIRGLQKLSLIDYSPYTCAVVFLQGCNFRCGFCHNPELVLGVGDGHEISKEEVTVFLKKRAKWLDGVCITGGEPTLNSDLPEFISSIKQLGYKVKLDSNGTNPSMLKFLLEDKQVDYLAMDIKTSLEEYKSVVNAEVDLNNIQESVALLMSSDIESEFRTTVVPGLHKLKHFEEIGLWLKGAKRFFIQNFSPKKCLNKSFEKIKPFSEKDLLVFKKILERSIEQVSVR